MLSSNFENEKFSCIYRLSSEMSPEKKELLMNWSSEQSKKGLKISFGTQTFLSQWKNLFGIVLQFLEYSYFYYY